MQERKAHRKLVDRLLEAQEAHWARKAALETAQARELFIWEASFASAAVPLLAAFALRPNAMNVNRPILLSSLLPLTFILANQYDRAFGNMTPRVLLEADTILLDEHQRKMRCRVPGPKVTVASLDASFKERA